MSISNMSWSKPTGKENLIAKKKVDLSMFRYGVHIPQEYHEDFLSVIPDNHIELGNSKKVNLIFDDRVDEVELRNINSKGRQGDTLQIRYDGNKDLINYLIDKFKSSYQYVINNKQDGSSKTIVPDNISEYIEFYKTGKSYEYKVSSISNNDIKINFFDYIGKSNKLNNSLYQKSYKLVLLLSMINNVDDDGKAEYNKVCKDILEFYINRNKQGLLAEQSDSRIQTEINSLTLDIVKSVMNENAFRVISEKGYILKEHSDDEYIIFNQRLWRVLTEDDLKSLEETLKSKLDIYYTTRVERESEVMIFKQYIEKIMKIYLQARNHEPFAGHELGDIFRKYIPEYLSELDFIDKEQYTINGSIGQGNWARIPWIALMNKASTTSTQNGVYVVYLFSKDMKKVYLTINQGVTEFKNELGTRGAKEKLIENAIEIRKKVNMDNTIAYQTISLDGGSLGDMYEVGTIGAIQYSIDSIPSDEKLIEDLEKMIIYYERYLDKITKKEDNTVINETNPKETISYIHQYITSKGYTYNLEMIINFYLALKSKPFVLLAGISGTGKSKLVELYAEAVGANTSNGRYNIVPVRPDWSDPSDLLGYRNIEGKFQPGPLTTIIKRAVDDTGNLPYFICLDEMNLARVEYYFSDILSVIETRKSKERIITDKLFKDEVFGDDENARLKYGYLYIPDNLYIVGTVNMDETTFPFSKKVLDRANTIEFNNVNLGVDFELFEDNEEELESLKIRNSELTSRYIKLIDCISEKEHIEQVIYILEKINEKLEKVGLQFGYRIRDEIIFYTLYAVKEELMKFDTAMDYAIKQKILPRIQGSSLSIKSILIELFKIFINNTNNHYDPYNNENWEKMYQYIKENKIKYPLSAEKICSMIRRHEVDGFTTFWE